MTDALMPVAGEPAVALSDGSELRLDVTDLDHLGLVAGIWDELGFTELLNEAIPADDQVAVRPGVVIKAMVLNIVCGRDPLYRVQKFFAGRPIDVLLGSEVRAENLNDAALARHLDRLFDGGCEKVYSTVALRAISREHLSVDRIHADTTSRLVFGEYRNPEGDDVISVTYGHSKDHRPDLKQVMMGIAVTEDGVPVIGQMLDGNQSDKTWNKALLGIVRTRLHLDRSRPLHYVGDSALITEDNLRVAQANGIVVTGRLPRTVNACDEAVRHAMSHDEQWEDIGTFSEAAGAARYRAQMQRATVLGHEVQLGIYGTTHADERAERSVLRRQETAFQQATKDARKLTDAPYSCEADARKAFDGLERSIKGKMLRVSCRIESRRVPAKAPRGRPKKGAVRPTVQQIMLSIVVEKDSEPVQEAIRDASCFVLLHTGKQDISARELLRIYKGQSLAETRFPFLKAPEWADVFFIKTPHRLEALGYVLMIALLIWSIWERRVRANLKRSGEPPLKDTTGFKKTNPTAAVNCHIMDGVRLIRAWRGDVPTPWRLAAPLGDEQARLTRFSAPIYPPAALPDATEKMRPLLVGG